MLAIDRYDTLVVGSGEAGKYLAWTLSKAGSRTALIERRMVGGSCPNVACLPSKNIIHGAKVASRSTSEQRSVGRWRDVARKGGIMNHSVVIVPVERATDVARSVRVATAIA